VTNKLLSGGGGLKSYLEQNVFMCEHDICVNES